MNRVTDRVKSIISHIERANMDYGPTMCIFHMNRPCLTLLNKFNSERFHCLFSNQSTIWRSYTVTSSCDIPDHFHDLILLNAQMGSDYVLPFAGHFRESSGYTIGMFRQRVHLYSPAVVERPAFKRIVMEMIVLYVAVCHRLGGVTPDIKHFSFAYTKERPVLCDIGGANSEKKELKKGLETFDKKKWNRFLKKKRVLCVIRYLKAYFPRYFQKKKKGKRCVLNEDGEAAFDDETHKLVCSNLFLIEALGQFLHLTSSQRLIEEWIESTSEM